MTVILWICVVLAALCAVCTLLVYVYLFRPNILRAKKAASDVPENEPELARYLPAIQSCAEWYYGQQKERVTIRSFDGLTLGAVFLPAENAKGTVVCMHGFHSSGLRDFSSVIGFFHSSGWNVLLPSQRAHEGSGGRYLTFGIRERFDCRDWVRYVNVRLGTELPVVLYGVSMGCATVVMSLGLDLPANVRSVVADCGFTTPYEEMTHVLKYYYHLPEFPLMLFARVLTRSIAGFGLKEYSTLSALEKNTIPVLFIHGADDTYVPTEMSRRNYAACRASKELYIVGGAKHAVSTIVDTARYEENVAAFLKKYAE